MEGEVRYRQWPRRYTAVTSKTPWVFRPNPRAVRRTDIPVDLTFWEHRPVALSVLYV